MTDKVSIEDWNKRFKEIYSNIKPLKNKLTQKEKEKRLRHLYYKDLDPLKYQDYKIEYRKTYYRKLKLDPERYKEHIKKIKECLERKY
jgi:hypothetical protein